MMSLVSLKRESVLEYFNKINNTNIMFEENEHYDFLQFIRTTTTDISTANKIVSFFHSFDFCATINWTNWTTE